MQRAVTLRVVTLALAAAASLAAGWAFLHLVGGYRPSWLDWLRTSVFAVTVFWLVWGGLIGMLGALAPRFRRPQDGGRPVGMSVVIIPVYNEDPMETFARVAAMNRQIVRMGLSDRFHFAILSDSTSLDVAAQELTAFQYLVREPMADGRIFYRRRERNVGRKAGNIEDFVAKSGAAYDYAIILDADSLMEGETLAAMARRMDDDPRLGLLQTVPEVIAAQSLFGRMMAFSSAFLSPYFARGVAMLQGEHGPYWGHNAIVRMRAFAQCCGLPVLSGKPPYGGHILSHDYVEAALLARGGWKVEADPYLGGSYEQGPDNLIEYAKRDRRWCQGNLQHRRLVFAPGLKFWSRFTFVQGIMAYMASPLWVILLVATMMATAYPDYGGDRWRYASWILGIGVAVTLLLPKLTIFTRATIDGANAKFGGTPRVGLSIISEIIVSSIMAPVLLAFQTRSVAQILLGLDGGWPATERDAQVVPLKTAFEASWWIVLCGIATLTFMAIEAPNYVLWMLPVSLPAILAPVLISLTSYTVGKGLFQTGSELAPTSIIGENAQILASWDDALPLDMPAVPAVTAHASA